MVPWKAGDEGSEKTGSFGNECGLSGECRGRLMGVAMVGSTDALNNTTSPAVSGICDEGESVDRAGTRGEKERAGAGH